MLMNQGVPRQYPAYGAVRGLDVGERTDTKRRLRKSRAGAVDEFGSHVEAFHINPLVIEERGPMAGTASGIEYWPWWQVFRPVFDQPSISVVHLLNGAKSIGIFFGSATVGLLYLHFGHM